MGSNDGSTWSKLQDGSITALPVPSTNNGSQNTSNYTISTSGSASQFANNTITGYAAASSTYSYFRVVVKNIIGNQYGATTESPGFLEMAWNPTFTSGSLSSSSVFMQLDSTITDCP